MRRILSLSKSAVLLLAILSAVVAALQFVVPLYMMAIYNRILQTQSLDSLKLISLIALVLLLVMGIVEMGRSRLLALMARRVSMYLNRDVYEAIMSSPASDLGMKMGFGPDRARMEPINDLRTVASFIAQGGLNTFFDAFFAPIFIVALFILHPLLGAIGLGAAVVIFALAFSAEVVARKYLKDVSAAEGSAQSALERSIGQFDAVAAMGMTQPLYRRWNAARSIATGQASRAQSVVSMLSNTAKSVRLMVQMGVLGAGAYLAVTTDYFLAGAIIASSIILGRALAPIDQSIGLWRPFVAARQSARRLGDVIDYLEAEPIPLDLPRPKAELNMDAVTLNMPGSTMPLLQNASLQISAGDVLGIFGSNGSGKTTLLKAMAGLIAPDRGVVALGTLPTRNMSGENRAEYLGYLPQDVQLLPGTIAENIARFRELDKNALFDAVELAGAEDFLQSLPLGYNTPLDTVTLSTGQKQLVGLARALYGNPVLLCLDEPSANLDVISRQKILTMIARRKADGLVTAIVSHEDSLLEQSTHLMQMGMNGRRGAARFGARDEIIKAMTHDAKKRSAK